MKQDLVVKLSKDLNSLYLKTGIKAIENVYVDLIKVVASGEKIDPIKQLLNKDVNKTDQPEGAKALIDAFVLLVHLPHVDYSIKRLYDIAIDSTGNKRIYNAIRDHFYNQSLIGLGILAALSRDNKYLSDESKKIIGQYQNIFDRIYNSSNNLFRTGLSYGGIKEYSLLLNQILEGSLDSEESVEKLNISQEIKTKIFSYVLRSVSNRVSNSLSQSLGSVDLVYDIDKRTEGVLRDIQKAISSTDAMSSPEALIQKCNIPQDFYSEVIFMRMDQKAKEVAYQVQLHMSRVEPENIPQMAEQVSNLIITSMVNAMGYGRYEAKKAPPPEDYYTKNDIPYDSKLETEDVPDKVIAEVSLILSISQVLSYLRPD